MRRTLGVAVFSGMLGVTLFGIFLTPVFFYVIQWFGDRGPAAAAPLPPGARIPVEVPTADGHADGLPKAKPVGP
jgi:multidrug efflux pump